MAQEMNMIARKCSVSGCDHPVAARDLCQTHYKRLKRHGDVLQTRPSDWGARERHPLYKVWNWLVRRYGGTGEIDTIWSLDFWRFVADVGEYPGKTHSIARADKTKILGPDNWYWRERAHSGTGEEYKERAREYQKRYRENNLRAQISKGLKRYYGIDIDQYESMLKDQNGACFICHGEERSVDPRTKKIRRLAVDHCHTKGKVRRLLCSDCNRGLASFRDDPQLLRQAADYIEQHRGEDSPE